MKKEIKLAIVVSSRYRKNSEVCLDLFNKYFSYEDNEVKIIPEYFVHTHKKVCDINHDKTKFSQNFLSQNDIDNITNILKPKKLVIEEDYLSIAEKLKDEIDNPWMFWCVDPKLNKDYSRFYQYHSFEEGVKLVWEYEKQNNMEYDFVFKIRPDLYLKTYENGLKDIHSQFSNDAIKELLQFAYDWEKPFVEIDPKISPWSAIYRVDNTLFGNEVRFICGYPKMCDTIFFASSKAMKKFAKNYFADILESTVRIYDEYKDKNIEVRDCLIVPESIIVQHTIRNKMNIIETPDRLISPVCIRSNWVNGGSFEDACRLYDEWWQGERKKLSKDNA